jgi:hypothetical protein
MHRAHPLDREGAARIAVEIVPDQIPSSIDLGEVVGLEPAFGRFFIGEWVPKDVSLGMQSQSP